MSYFTPPEVISRLRIGENIDDGNQPRGCLDPTADYGETEGVSPFEVGLANGDIIDIPEVEWPERLEALERNNATLLDRIDADWTRALTQGRCGYCWAYAVIGAMMTSISRDTGRKGEKTPHLSAARVAAIIKGGRDQGGWPVEAAAFIAKNGTCLESEWRDCTCKGKECRGPRSGCPARDLSRVEATAALSKLTTLDRHYEIPRGKEGMRALIIANLQGLSGACGWVRTGEWCDGHAMNTPHIIRDKRRGWLGVPDNSWGQLKRRFPFSTIAGGVVVVSAKRTAA